MNHTIDIVWQTKCNESRRWELWQSFGEQCRRPALGISAKRWQYDQTVGRRHGTTPWKPFTGEDWITEQKDKARNKARERWSERSRRNSGNGEGRTKLRVWQPVVDRALQKWMRIFDRGMADSVEHRIWKRTKATTERADCKTQCTNYVACHKSMMLVVELVETGLARVMTLNSKCIKENKNNARRASKCLCGHECMMYRQPHRLVLRVNKPWHFVKQ